MSNDNEHIVRVARLWVINRPDYNKRAMLWSNENMAEAFMAGVEFCRDELREVEDDSEPSLQEQVEALHAYVSVMQKKVLDLEKCLEAQTDAIVLASKDLKSLAESVDRMWHAWTRGV